MQAEQEEKKRLEEQVARLQSENARLAALGSVALANAGRADMDI